MLEKTLEKSIAERLDTMSKLKRSDHDAFANYLTIIKRATITRDHSDLDKAVRRAARELGMEGHEEFGPACASIVRGHRYVYGSRLSLATG